MDPKAIDHIFGYHKPKDQSIADLHQEVRARCAALAHWIDEALPDSREKSSAITRVEEAMYYTNAGVARLLNYSD